MDIVGNYSIVTIGGQKHLCGVLYDTSRGPDGTPLGMSSPIVGRVGENVVETKGGNLYILATPESSTEQANFEELRSYLPDNTELFPDAPHVDGFIDEWTDKNGTNSRVMGGIVYGDITKQDGTAIETGSIVAKDGRLFVTNEGFKFALLSPHPVLTPSATKEEILVHLPKAQVRENAPGAHR